MMTEINLTRSESLVFQHQIVFSFQFSTLLATVEDWRSVAAHVHCDTIVVAANHTEIWPPASKSVSKLSCRDKNIKATQTVMKNILFHEKKLLQL